MQATTLYIKNFLLLIISVQILNSGLFAQDFPTKSKDQNVVSSVTEYIAEVLLNRADFFPEHLKKSNPTHHKNPHSLLHKVQQYNLIKHNVSNVCFVFKEEKKAAEYNSINNTFFQSIIFDIIPPPPKA